MDKRLVIVESPAKSKTIKKFLGKGWEVQASLGHIKDLPKQNLGVNIEKDFQPKYVVIPGKSKIISQLKFEAKSASQIYLAPDPDREGEAIAWHITKEIEKVNPHILRASFNEITKDGVKRGIKEAGPIDMNKVNAQQARRILDRLVGYKVSPILWKTVYRGLSAGRVQSVALRIICEREAEIEKFIPEEYWDLTALLETDKKECFSGRLFKIADKDFKIENQDQAQSLIDDIKNKAFQVAEIKKEKRYRNPYPPHITSTLEQDAAQRLYFSSQKTMKVAQELYEGIELGEKESDGLITYMRTDSVRVSNEAKDAAKGFIGKNFGERYLPEKPREYRSKKTAQEAHEAIRPTFVDYTPDEIKKFLSKDQFKLYQLIWKRFLASQMSSAQYDSKAVEIKAEKYLFKASSSTLIFDGFLKVYEEIKEENSEREEEGKIPELEVGERLNLVELKPQQHFTKPPAKFTEASLIKELEANGIGRPSTYAQIVTTIKLRKYVTSEKRKLFPTELGFTVNKILVENFPKIFNVKFTANMESELDKIEEGEDEWTKVLKDFYVPFEITLKKVEQGKKEIKEKLIEKTDELCGKCGKPMVIKWSKNGRFLACSGFPDCKNTKPLFTKEEEQIINNEKCELCGAEMVLKNGKFGRFLACSKYPDCKNTRPLSLGIECPEKDCGGFLVEKKSRRGNVFYGCSNYPRCNFATWDKPVAFECPQCQAKIMVEKRSKSKGEYLKCIKCGHEKKAEAEVVQ